MDMETRASQASGKEPSIRLVAIIALPLGQAIIHQNLNSGWPRFINVRD